MVSGSCTRRDREYRTQTESFEPVVVAVGRFLCIGYQELLALIGIGTWSPVTSSMNGPDSAGRISVVAKQWNCFLIRA